MHARRAGKAAPLMAEQLCLDQGRRDRPTVHGDERSATSRAGVMNAARHEFLAGAALTDHEHRGVARRHARDGGAQPGHGIGRAEHAVRFAPHRMRGIRDDAHPINCLLHFASAAMFAIPFYML